MRLISNPGTRQNLPVLHLALTKSGDPEPWDIPGRENRMLKLGKKKDKPPADEATALAVAHGAEVEGDAPKKKKLPLLFIIAPVALLVLGGGGAGAYFMFLAPKPAAAEEGHGEEGHDKEGHGKEGHNGNGHGEAGHGEAGHGEGHAPTAKPNGHAPVAIPSILPAPTPR